ncbi:signal transduction histidine kinase [Hymenobacter luteus]|uniref:histidine kinase n=2 Tax=Hymenobacter TaxID=89966 RepID=A0A7W9WCR5_9BACT|nr:MULTISPECIES: tetratricopeptide repeat protein [Hymenobacter]MBB4601925.1 signal transduction histidine kinase [Hymenobacter latericoloratus]MBB6059646.1 signal transduction histidine kinase [Hymenobacter luteus]
MIQRFLGLLLAAVVLTSSAGWAQSPQTRVLQRALRHASSDTARTLLLADLAATYRYSRFDSVQWYARQGLALARRIGYRKGEGRCLSRIALLLGERGNLPQALRVDLQALHLNEVSHDLEGTARTLNQTGLLYFSLDDYRPSLQYYSRAWRLYQQAHTADTSQLVSVLTNMGASYVGLGRYDSAAFFLNRAWALTRRARTLHQSCWGTPAPYVLRELGLLQVALGRPEAALRFYRQSVRAAAPENDRRSASRSYQYMAELYHARQQPDSSIYYARKALVLGQSLPFTVGIVRNSKLLTRAFGRQQQPDSTLKYMGLLLMAQDSLHNPQRIKQLDAIGFAEQQRLRQLEEERDKMAGQIRTAALLAGVAVLLLVSVLLGRNNRQQQRANQRLQSLNEQVTHQARQLTAQRDNLARTLQELKITQSQLVLREKMASLGELMAGVAHEIQTPVSSARKFAAISAELCTELRHEVARLITRPYERELLDEMLQNLLQNQTRILQFAQRADSIVQGMLEYSQDGSGPRQPTKLNALAEEYLRLTYHDLRAKNRYFTAALLLRLDPAVGSVQVVRQDIGRALVGIFSAALQAVLQRQAAAEAEDNYVPQVELHTRRTAETVELLVRDNGPGLSAEAMTTLFQRFPERDGSSDLGLPLSYDLITRGLKGQLTATSQPGQGTEYMVTLPLPLDAAT